MRPSRLYFFLNSHIYIYIFNIYLQISVYACCSQAALFRFNL